MGPLRRAARQRRVDCVARGARGSRAAVLVDSRAPRRLGVVRAGQGPAGSADRTPRRSAVARAALSDGRARVQAGVAAGGPRPARRSLAFDAAERAAAVVVRHDPPIGMTEPSVFERNLANYFSAWSLAEYSRHEGLWPIERQLIAEYAPPPPAAMLDL